jgi:hypothetical protein
MAAKQPPAKVVAVNDSGDEIYRAPVKTQGQLRCS